MKRESSFRARLLQSLQHRLETAGGAGTSGGRVGSQSTVTGRWPSLWPTTTGSWVSMLRQLAGEACAPLSERALWQSVQGAGIDRGTVQLLSGRTSVGVTPQLDRVRNRIRHSRGRRHLDTIRVAPTSKPTAVAGAIAASLRQSNEANVQAIGPKAVNQAMKAIAVARGYLALDGLTIICVRIFIEVYVDKGKRTAMRFCVEPR